MSVLKLKRVFKTKLKNCFIGVFFEKEFSGFHCGNCSMVVHYQSPPLISDRFERHLGNMEVSMVTDKFLCYSLLPYLRDVFPNIYCKFWCGYSLDQYESRTESARYARVITSMESKNVTGISLPSTEIKILSK